MSRPRPDFMKDADRETLKTHLSSRDETDEPLTGIEAYSEAITRGLSDAEAREEGWPSEERIQEPGTSGVFGRAVWPEAETCDWCQRQRSEHGRDDECPTTPARPDKTRFWARSAGGLRPPEVWHHAKHGLHDEAHHQHHNAMDVCVPLDYATPERRSVSAEADGAVSRIHDLRVHVDPVHVEEFDAACWAAHDILREVSPVDAELRERQIDEFMAWLFRDGQPEPPRRDYDAVEQRLRLLVNVPGPTEAELDRAQLIFDIDHMSMEDD